MRGVGSIKFYPARWVFQRPARPSPDYIPPHEPRPETIPPEQEPPLESPSEIETPERIPSIRDPEIPVPVEKYLN